MVKQKITPKRYTLVCQSCGFKRGVLPKDHKRGVA